METITVSLARWDELNESLKNKSDQIQEMYGKLEANKLYGYSSLAMHKNFLLGMMAGALVFAFAFTWHMILNP